MSCARDETGFGVGTSVYDSCLLLLLCKGRPWSVSVSDVFFSGCFGVIPVGVPLGRLTGCLGGVESPSGELEELAIMLESSEIDRIGCRTLLYWKV